MLGCSLPMNVRLLLLLLLLLLPPGALVGVTFFVAIPALLLCSSAPLLEHTPALRAAPVPRGHDDGSRRNYLSKQHQSPLIAKQTTQITGQL